MAGLASLDDKDLVAVALQIARRTNPDHAGADHANPFAAARRHRPSPKSPPRMDPHSTRGNRWAPSGTAFGASRRAPLVLNLATQAWEPAGGRDGFRRFDVL